MGQKRDLCTSGRLRTVECLINQIRMYVLTYSAEQMTVEVWNYIFFGGDFPNTDIPIEALK